MLAALLVAPDAQRGARRARWPDGTAASRPGLADVGRHGGTQHDLGRPRASRSPGTSRPGRTSSGRRRSARPRTGTRSWPTGKIFLGTNNGNPRNPEIKGDKGVLMCFRESDGQFLWQAVTDKLESGAASDWPEAGRLLVAGGGREAAVLRQQPRRAGLPGHGRVHGRQERRPVPGRSPQGADRCRRRLEARHEEGPGRVPALHGELVAAGLGGSRLRPDLQRPRQQ